jgi:DNA-binding NtrC family response regulator
MASDPEDHLLEYASPSPPTMSSSSGKTGEMATSKRSHRPQAMSSSSPKTPSTFTLAVVEGKDAGLSFTIDAKSPARVLVGQSPLCTVVLSDVEVSRRHVSLRPIQSALEVRDLESTNGTTVNGVTIREALLHGGETLRIGSTVLSVTRGDPELASLAHGSSFGRLLGESRVMRKIYPVLERLSTSQTAVLIEGEAGTGKELCAEELHLRGPRREAAFVTLETASLDEREMSVRLFEGEDSLVAMAKLGTLVIDDVADLPLYVQEKLLAHFDGAAGGAAGAAAGAARAPKDGSSPRLILTTSRDLDRAVAEGTFREDLLARLASSHVTLPPLRDRDGDVKLLAEKFWSLIAPPGDGLPADFLPRFEHYPWPGNVRELESAVEARLRLGALGAWKREQSTARAEGDFIGAVVQKGLPFAQAKQVLMNEFERRYVEELVARHGGSIQRAAAASGLAQRYFQLIRARHKK